MELRKNFEPRPSKRNGINIGKEKRISIAALMNGTPYTIVMPPPNVTGVLHMGHSFNNTVQDILVRRARMSGKNACWVPGTDHASIATEAKVVQMLREKGIIKIFLSDEFLHYACEWKEKYGGIICNQIENLDAVSIGTG